jgi:hypothetical protein
LLLSGQMKGRHRFVLLRAMQCDERWARMRPVHAIIKTRRRFRTDLVTG